MLEQPVYIDDLGTRYYQLSPEATERWRFYGSLPWPRKMVVGEALEHRTHTCLLAADGETLVYVVVARKPCTLPFVRIDIDDEPTQPMFIVRGAREGIQAAG